MYDQHCRDLIKAWYDIVIDTNMEGEQIGPGVCGLCTVWIMEALTTAVEMGFQRPAAGHEIEWLRENKAEFERLAKKGDEGMQYLMTELAIREDFSGVLATDSWNTLRWSLWEKKNCLLYYKPLRTPTSAWQFGHLRH